MMAKDTFIAQAPIEIQPLLEEREELLQVFPPVYCKYEYGYVQYKTDNLTGVMLWQETGGKCWTWGDISELQVLQAQRLWAIDQQLKAYRR